MNEQMKNATEINQDSKDKVWTKMMAFQELK